MPLGVALAPGASVTLDLEVRTSIQPDNGAKRRDSDPHLDLKDANGGRSTTLSSGNAVGSCTAGFC